MSDRVHGSVLVDGALRAVWRIDRDRARGTATLVVTHVDRLTKRATSALGAKRRRVLRSLAADAESYDVRLHRTSQR
jgi:hypothetical protein